MPSGHNCSAVAVRPAVDDGDAGGAENFVEAVVSGPILRIARRSAIRDEGKEHLVREWLGACCGARKFGRARSAAALLAYDSDRSTIETT